MENVEQVFEKIMKAQKWEKQQLAEHIGVHPSTLSQKLGAHWNAHWRVFVKLLPLMVQLEIIGHDELHGTSDKNAHDNKHKSGAKVLETQENAPANGGKNPDIMSPIMYGSFTLQ